MIAFFTFSRTDLRCPCCGAVLAQTDGKRVYFNGNGGNDQTTTILCLRCNTRRARVVWHPQPTAREIAAGERWRRGAVEG